MRCSAPVRAKSPLFGFRSGAVWRRACAWAFFAALYVAFSLTMFPPVEAGNRDVLVYKAVRLALFAIPILSVLCLSDFRWCRRLPLFSSERRSQRLTGVVALAALLLCLSANLTYLHTPEYREALLDKGAALVSSPQELTSAEGEAAPGAVASPEGAGATTGDGDGSLASAWNDRREGCGTD